MEMLNMHITYTDKLQQKHILDVEDSTLEISLCSVGLEKLTNWLKPLNTSIDVEHTAVTHINLADETSLVEHLRKNLSLRIPVGRKCMSSYARFFLRCFQAMEEGKITFVNNGIVRSQKLHDKEGSGSISNFLTTLRELNLVDSLQNKNNRSGFAYTLSIPVINTIVDLLRMPKFQELHHKFKLQCKGLRNI